MNRLFIALFVTFALVAGVAYSQDVIASNYNNGVVYRLTGALTNAPGLSVPTNAISSITLDTTVATADAARAIGARTSGTRRIGIYATTALNYGVSATSRTEAWMQSIATSTWTYFCGKQAEIEAMYLNPQGTSAATVTVYIRDYTN